jgi:NADP-dependent 3-hydroxy acid dehydrogenase YdfG
MEQLDGKFAFITGGASGIGLGIARVLVDVGMKVMIADIRKDHLERALALFDSLGKSRSVVGTELDVTDRDGYARCADAIYQEWGAVHVLVSPWRRRRSMIGIGGSMSTWAEPSTPCAPSFLA